MKIDTDVLIIGSGFSGLGMGIRMRQAGLHNFIILEQAEELGGTWRDNHYPGVACDIPSHLYSYSFEPNPNWSRLFARQHEILAYLNHCADKYGVRPHVHFRSSVSKAAFDQRLGVWEVTTAHGRVYRSRALVRLFTQHAGTTNTRWKAKPWRSSAPARAPFKSCRRSSSV